MLVKTPVSHHYFWRDRWRAQLFWVQEGLFSSPVLHTGHLTGGSAFPAWIILGLQGGHSQGWRMAIAPSHGRICLWTGGGPGAKHRAQGTLSNSVAAAHHQPWYSHEDKVLVSSLNCNNSHLLLKWYFSELLGTFYSRNLAEGHLLLMYF